MALGRGGIRTERQHGALGRSRQATYGRHLEASELLLRGEARSRREALRLTLGRQPTGRDYRDFEALAGKSPRDWQRLYRGSGSLPFIAPDGIYDTVPGATWRQRSIVGQQWALVANAKQMSDERLARELRRFRNVELRVLDEQGRTVRMRAETDPGRFRRFSESPEARQERIISPRLGASDFNAGRG